MDFKRDTELEDTLLEEMGAAFYEPDRHQPSVTGMIRCLTRTYYESEMSLDTGKPKYSRRELQLFAMGLGLEKVLLAGRQRVIGGEFEGIQFHVDHIGIDGNFIELKSTRINAVHDDNPRVSDHWKKQVLSYFKALGITSGHFVMFHVMGDRKPPFPDIRAYEVITTQEEIDANWVWMQQRAITYLKYVKEGEPPPPFQFNEEWECQECPWLGLCHARRIISEPDNS